MKSPFILLSFVVAGILFLSTCARAEFCPFCTAVDKTLTDDIASMDVAVIAKLIKTNEVSTSKEGEELTDDELALQEIDKSDFEIIEIVKGKEFLKPGMKFQAIFFGDSKIGDKFFVLGVSPPDISWSTPLAVADESIAYINKLSSLPEADGRLEFFQDYLEHPNDLLSRDAYDEFAKAPYEQVVALKPKMNRPQLLDWIQQAEIPASRKRLYFTMLGICGKAEDAALLAELMKSEDRLQKAGLDAMVACYLNLIGEKGLTTINELFLSNEKCDYSDTYAAISALRFHGMETDRIDIKKLVASLRLVLTRAKYCDLVIPDLARWEDWDSMQQLVDLFKNSPEDNSWVRIPVINYLRACPLPKAKEHLVELEKLDPKAVKRAITFFPLLDEEDDEEEEDEEKDDTPELQPEKAGQTEIETQSGSNDAPMLKSPIEPTGEAIPTSVNNDETTFVSNEVPVKADAGTNFVFRPARDSDDSVIAAVHDSVGSGDSAAMVAEVSTEQTVFIGFVALISCGLLYGLMWLVISGRIDRIGF